MTIQRLDNGDFQVKFECDLRTVADKKMFVAVDRNGHPKKPEGVPIIVRMGRGRKLLDGILSGEFESQAHAGESIGASKTQSSRLIRLAFLSPEIVEKVLAGRLNAQRTMDLAEKLISIPIWSEQHKALGIE